MTMGEQGGEEVLPHLRATEELPRPARPVPATDVQVAPVVPLPEPPSPPPTVQEPLPAPVEQDPPAPPPPYAAPATVVEPVPSPYGAPGRRGGVVPPGAPRRPADPGGSGGWAGRRLGLGIAVAGVLLVAIGGLVAVFGVSGHGKAPAPAPCGHPPCAPSPARIAPVPAAQVAYRTVERDAGYFEGTVTIANHGTSPMRSWTLSFTYPGADIHNTWDAVLRHQGTETVLTSAATSPPIAPGATLQVRFGGSGTPSTPTGCRLNGTPCAFVAG